jgi:hypothetical protein
MIADAKEVWNKPLFGETMILGAWNIWKIRNRAYFEGVQPDTENWQRQLKQDLSILECRIKEDLQEPLRGIIARIHL